MNKQIKKYISETFYLLIILKNVLRILSYITIMEIILPPFPMLYIQNKVKVKQNGLLDIFNL